MLRKLAKFWKSKGGLAAVEFGLIAPVMGTLLVGTVEVCNALQCKAKKFIQFSLSSKPRFPLGQVSLDRRG